MSCGTIESGCGAFTVTVDVLQTSKSRNVEGYEVDAWTVAETLTNVDKQPAGGEIAEKEYGITDRDCKFQLFIFQSTIMQKNSKLRINGEFFEVRGFHDWDEKNKDAIIKPYNGTLVVV